MKTFLLKIICFSLFGLLLGEIVVRVFSLTTDVPKMYQADDGLIKYYPSQKGNYLNGSHKWIINKYGHFGYEPPTLDRVITVIGDSFISNIMNPPECHQAKYLAEYNPHYNFFPGSRDGASFLESMIRKKSLEKFDPVVNLLYVSTSDFEESIAELGRDPKMLQISLKENKIYYPTLQGGRLKSLLYKFRFAYYLYRNYVIPKLKAMRKKEQLVEVKEKKNIKPDYAKIEQLMNYIGKNYGTDKIILVFHPGSDEGIIKIVQEAGFKTLHLKVDREESWQLPNDSHWSCYGHKEVARQVTNYLKFHTF